MEVHSKYEMAGKDIQKKESYILDYKENDLLRRRKEKKKPSIKTRLEI